ncbi:Intramembrane protease RasP/YluC implicated incell division based on FtsL cleavage [Salmonella enterica subsp. enterica]|uniref:Intramembrane protease RasP/YluC implicated incell division based on FtsL cleavage n=1 Tax=Salmonella enterica I TaxID=59201 RepID=A0A3S5DDK8_SALET|nr:Intramembrane protease RasP/YluC implicated incell division based on FtsL cleavage [Salmonella enterica subsp. enterica]
MKLNNLSGPISIAQGAGMSAEFGGIYYLMFLALISVNLGIINLFPLPVLDGGHLLFLAIEKLKGGRYPSGFKTLVIALARFCWCC